MAIEIRLPNITGHTEKEQLAQLKSYLYQLREQLQFAFDSIGTGSSVAPGYVQPQKVTYQMGLTPADAEATFSAIKSLIIKSADIVDSYYDEITTKLEGSYVAQSEFGEFAEKTTQMIEETSTSTTQRFENVQVIINRIDGDVSAHESNIASIEGSLQTIGEDLSYAQNSIVTINQSVESLDGYVAKVEGEVGALDTTVQGLDTTIQSTKSELSGSIDSAKSELSSSINSTKESLVGDINSAKTELSESINSAKEELSGDIDSAKTELSGMVEGVEADLEEAKTATNERIDDTNGSVANLGEGLNDAKSKIADVNEDLQTSKAAMNNSIQGVQASVTGVNALLEDAKAQLKGSIDDLEIYMKGIQQVIIGVTAYLKSGLLYYTDAGIPVYGMEIGQTVRDEVAGVEVFNKYARFTSEKLSFYDSNGNEVAYISDKKLYIRFAEITTAFKIGGLMDLVMANGDVVTKWVGG